MAERNIREAEKVNPARPAGGDLRRWPVNRSPSSRVQSQHESSRRDTALDQAKTREEESEYSLSGV
jgi:hypothetical protein